MAAASGPWVETDAPAPSQCVWSQTKLEGEQLVIGALSAAPDFPDQLGLCSAWWQFCERPCCAWRRRRERLTVIDDQIGAPTGADLLADVTAHALRQAQHQPEDGGPVPPGCRRRNQLAWVCPVRDRSKPGVRRLRPPSRPSTVDPVPTTAFPTPARRPLNSRLATDRLRSGLQPDFAPVATGGGAHARRDPVTQSQTAFKYEITQRHHPCRRLWHPIASADAWPSASSCSRSTTSP
jgi:dTDP-4-dehydrorhamnose reductase